MTSLLKAQSIKDRDTSIFISLLEILVKGPGFPGYQGSNNIQADESSEKSDEVMVTLQA